MLQPIAVAKFASDDIEDERLAALATSMLNDREKTVRNAASEALGEWLWAKARRQPQLDRSLAQLLSELNTDNSRLNSAYRNGVGHALGKCLTALSIELKDEPCFDSPAMLHSYLYESTEVWPASSRI